MKLKWSADYIIYDLHSFTVILSYSFLYHRSDDHGDDHFYQISRDEWYYTDCECCLESVICDQAEPYGSKKVTNDGSNNHAAQLDPSFVAVVAHKSGNDCHYDKSDDISACRTCQFGRSACESGEYREANKSEQKIDQITDGSFFSPEKIQGQVDRQVGE